MYIDEGTLSNTTFQILFFQLVVPLYSNGFVTIKKTQKTEVLRRPKDYHALHLTLSDPGLFR